MFGEIFSSTHEYIKSKLANPFLGTLIFVWLIRNWFLVYSLFTFDKNFGWKEKTEFIKSYLNHQDFWCELLADLWISFVLLIASFIILLLTRLITNVYEFKLLPLTYKYTEKTQIVTKERYNQLAELHKEKETRLELISAKITDQERILNAKETALAEITDQHTKVSAELHSLKSDYEIDKKFFELDKTANEINKLRLDSYRYIFAYKIFADGKNDEDLAISLHHFIRADDSSELESVINTLFTSDLMLAFLQYYIVIALGTPYKYQLDRVTIRKLAELNLFVQTPKNLTVMAGKVDASKFTVSNLGRELYQVISRKLDQEHDFFVQQRLGPLLTNG